LVPVLEGEAIQYFGDNKLNYLQILFSYILTSLTGAMEAIHEELFTYGGYMDEHEIYNTTEPQLTKATLDGLQEVLDDLEEEIESLKSQGLEKVAAIMNEGLINSLSEILEDDTPLDNLANYNRAGYIDATISEKIFQRMYDEEELDELRQEIQDEAWERHRELAENAEEDARKIFNLFDKLKISIKQIIQQLSDLEAAQNKIDNTR
ncbi:hypothetical protein ACFWDG_26905, partial [Peribacillus sp. NPDC060186]